MAAGRREVGARAMAGRLSKGERGVAGPVEQGKQGASVPVGAGKRRNPEGRARGARPRCATGKRGAPWEPRRCCGLRNSNHAPNRRRNVKMTAGEWGCRNREGRGQTARQRPDRAAGRWCSGGKPRRGGGAREPVRPARRKPNAAERERGGRGVNRQ